MASVIHNFVQSWRSWALAVLAFDALDKQTLAPAGSATSLPIGANAISFVNPGASALPASIATNGNAFIGSSAAGGLQLTGLGTSEDIELINGAGTVVAQIPTGTTTFAVPGSLLLGTPAGSPFNTYQEGVWVPNDQSGASLTFTSVSGNYIKIGKMVWCNFSLTYPATASGAANGIGGLPYFASNDFANAGGGPIIFNSGNTAGWVFNVTQNTETGMILSGGTPSIPNSTLSGLTIRGTFTYKATT